MSRELHHRKSDDKYALWSSVVDGYITDWGTKDDIRAIWLSDMIADDIKKVDKYMGQIDKEVK